MAEQKENSVLFSLKELMNLEEERVRREEDDRRRRDEDARRRRDDEVRRAKAEEAERIKAAEEARRLEEARLRAEQDRAQREREEAELRVRFEAETRARQDAQERLLSHERRLAEIAAQQRRGVGGGVVLAAVAGILAVASAGAWLGVIKPSRDESARQQQAIERDVADARHRAEEERARADAEAARVRQLNDAIHQHELELQQHPPTQVPVTPPPTHVSGPTRPTHRQPHPNTRRDPLTDPGSIPGINDL